MDAAVVEADEYWGWSDWDGWDGWVWADFSRRRRGFSVLRSPALRRCACRFSPSCCCCSPRPSPRPRRPRCPRRGFPSRFSSPFAARVLSGVDAPRFLDELGFFRFADSGSGAGSASPKNRRFKRLNTPSDFFAAPVEVEVEVEVLDRDAGADSRASGITVSSVAAGRSRRFSRIFSRAAAILSGRLPSAKAAGRPPRTMRMRHSGGCIPASGMTTISRPNSSSKRRKSERFSFSKCTAAASGACARTAVFSPPRRNCARMRRNKVKAKDSSRRTTPEPLQRGHG